MRLHTINHAEVRERILFFNNKLMGGYGFVLVVADGTEIRSIRKLAARKVNG
jgi:hypothetical protein